MPTGLVAFRDLHRWNVDVGYDCTVDYRDDREATRRRAESLEDQLAEANQRLTEASARLVAQAEQDAEEERRLAEVEDEVRELRRRLGLPTERRLASKKKSDDTVMIVMLVTLVIIGLVMVGGVLTYLVMEPSAGEAPAPSSPLAPLIVGGAFALFGLPMVLGALITFRKDRDIGKWPRASGRVLSSSVESSTYTAKDSQGYYQQYTSHWPELSYTYSVGGTEYEGNAVARSHEATTNRAAVQKCVDRYAAGKEIMVMYDPDDPSTAYLEVTRSIGAVIMLAFGGMLMALGLLVASQYFS